MILRQDRRLPRRSFQLCSTLLILYLTVREAGTTKTGNRAEATAESARFTFHEWSSFSTAAVFAHLQYHGDRSKHQYLTDTFVNRTASAFGMDAWDWFEEGHGLPNATSQGLSNYMPYDIFYKRRWVGVTPQRPLIYGLNTYRIQTLLGRANGSFGWLGEIQDSEGFIMMPQWAALSKNTLPVGRYFRRYEWLIPNAFSCHKSWAGVPGAATDPKGAMVEKVKSVDSMDGIKQVLEETALSAKRSGIVTSGEVSKVAVTSSAAGATTAPIVTGAETFREADTYATSRDYGVPQETSSAFFAVNQSATTVANAVTPSAWTSIPSLVNETSVATAWSPATPIEKGPSASSSFATVVTDSPQQTRNPPSDWKGGNRKSREIRQLSMLPPFPEKSVRTRFAEKDDLNDLVENGSWQLLPQLSQGEYQDVDFLVLIVTAPQYFEQRRVFRQYAKSFFSTPHTTQFRFIVGVPTKKVGRNNDCAYEDCEYDVRTMYRLLEEQKKFGDLIMGDFPDYYRSLTQKTIAIHQWAAEHCPTAKFVIKTDIDCGQPWRLIFAAAKQQFEPQDHRGLSFGQLLHLYTGTERRERHIYYMSKFLRPYELHPTFNTGGVRVVEAGLSRRIAESAIFGSFLSAPVEDLNLGFALPGFMAHPTAWVPMGAHCDKLNFGCDYKRRKWHYLKQCQGRWDSVSRNGWKLRSFMDGRQSFRREVTLSLEKCHHLCSGDTALIPELGISQQHSRR